MTMLLDPHGIVSLTAVVDPGRVTEIRRLTAAATKVLATATTSTAAQLVQANCTLAQVHIAMIAFPIKAP